MQERGVRRVDAYFECLQPVAIDVALERERMAVRCDEAVDLRKRRRLAFAKVSPQDAALLDHGIGSLLDSFAEVRALRLRGRLDALAGRVEQPAMEPAAQAAI